MHDPTPDGWGIYYVPFGPCCGDDVLSSDGCCDYKGPFFNVRGHGCVDDARLDGHDVNALFEHARAKPTEISCESSFGSSVDVV